MQLAASVAVALGNQFLFAQPVRLLNRSLHREIDRLTDERLLPLLLIMFAFWIVCVVEWTQHFAGAIPDPRFWTLLALIVTAYGGFQVFALRRVRTPLKTSSSALQQTAQILEAMRGKGFVPTHNLVSDGTSIDHVVVGPAGIYTIASKLRTGTGMIDYRNEEELVFGDRIKDRRPLRQAREAAHALQCQLNRRFDPAPAVKPLLVFVGDWQVHCSPGAHEVEVLSAQELETFFDNQRPEFSAAEVTQIVAALRN